jgi:hypothetical protein
MPRQKTGRPLGRPVIYSEDERPVTVSLRIPHALAAKLKRYAVRHRQSVTALLLDGLKWRLEQEDPRWPSQNGMQYYDNPVLQELTTPVHFVDDRIPFDEERLPTRSDAPEQQAPDAVPAEALGAPVQDTRQTESDVPAYEPTKYTLGKLCPRGHDYQGTGQTLLRLTNRHCLACDREKFHERKQATRRVQPV